MASRIGVFATSVGTKILIGLSGLFLVFYLLIHIGGNLVVFAGPAAYNQYAFTLERNKAVLYPLELLILAGFLTHIYKTVRMFLGNQQARPVAYAQKKRAGWLGTKEARRVGEPQNAGVDDDDRVGPVGDRVSHLSRESIS